MSSTSFGWPRVGVGAVIASQPVGVRREPAGSGQQHLAVAAQRDHDAQLIGGGCRLRLQESAPLPSAAAIGRKDVHRARGRRSDVHRGAVVTGVAGVAKRSHSQRVAVAAERQRPAETIVVLGLFRSRRLGRTQFGHAVAIRRRRSRACTRERRKTCPTRGTPARRSMSRRG